MILVCNEEGAVFVDVRSISNATALVINVDDIESVCPQCGEAPINEFDVAGWEAIQQLGFTGDDYE